MATQPTISPTVQMWLDARNELGPAKSISRITDSAKFMVGSLTLIGTLLTAAGFVSIDRLRVAADAAAFAAVAAGLATFVVLLSVYSLLIKVRRINPANLEEVKAWYADEFGKGKLLGFAGWVLLAAIVLAACSALTLLSKPNLPSMSLQFVGQGQDAQLSGKAGFQGLKPGTEVEAIITGEKQGSPDAVLARTKATADATGKVDIAQELTEPGDYDRFVLTVNAAGETHRTTLEMTAGP